MVKVTLPGLASAGIRMPVTTPFSFTTAASLGLLLVMSVTREDTSRL